MDQPITPTPPEKATRSRVPLYIAIGAAATVLLALFLFLLFFPGSPSPAAPGDPTATAPSTNAPITEPPLPVQTTSPVPSNPFSPEDFRYEGDYLTCTTAESILGIDVSGYQQEIDWQQVSAAGIRFAMIRVGGRGWGASGTLYDDSRALANYTGAREAGLQVGVYFFSQAITVEEAREEAQYILSYTEGWELDLPIVFDWEYVGPEARTAFMDARTLTDCTFAFCQSIEAAGREAMVYFNPVQSSTLLYLDELLEYRFWLAMYQDAMDYPHKVDMWQYTRKGSVPGIEGDVDINLYFPHK